MVHNYLVTLFSGLAPISCREINVANCMFLFRFPYPFLVNCGIYCAIGFTGTEVEIDNSDTVEAEHSETYVDGVTDGHDMATYTDEGAYSYPIVDPDESIEAKRNNAYAANIVTKKNEAYKPVSTASVSGTTDEYDYI